MSGVSGVLILYQVLLTPVWQRISLLNDNITWVHREDVNVKPLPTWTRVWRFFFLDQAVADFDSILDSIHTDPVITLGLDTSFDEPDSVT